MNILLLNNSAFTNKNNCFFCEKRTGEFAEELMELGNKIKMVGLFVDSKSRTHTYNVSKSNITVQAISATNIKPLRYLRLYLSIIPEIYKADFIYIFFPSSLKYVAFFCKILGKPYGLYVRGQHDLNSKSSLRLYRSAYTIFTVSNSFTKLIKEKSGNKKVFTIRPMINFTEEDINYNRKFDTPDFFNILYLGRIEKDKGIPELLRAIKSLKNKKTNFVLSIIGDGSYYKEMVSTIKKLDIQDITLTLGNMENTEDIRKAYQEADLFISPSHHEGFPRTLYEAMIFGTPIITTFVGAIPSIMKSHFNCLETQPRSSKSLEDSIEFAIDNYDIMIKCAKNGFDTVAPIIDSSKPSHARQINSVLKNLRK